MLSGLLSLIVPAVVPALTDGVRGIFAKFTGGAGGTPQNVNERIQLMEAETKRLQALAEIDKPAGEPSRWVTDMRSSFRYIAILVIWIATIFAVFDTNVSQNIVLMMLDLSGACMSFVIGERMYLSLKK
ncbi:MAG: hypothetical protein [Caudovirales sp. ctOwN3]|nr:MAG: hypothetical protein [Caudovirales sp. ctOwN3]